MVTLSISDLNYHYLLSCLVNYWPTYSMQQSPSSEANCIPVSQEIPRILWVPKVQYSIRKSLPPVSIPSEVTPVHAPFPLSEDQFLILSCHLCLCLASVSFHSFFPTKTVYAALVSSVRAICPAFLILLDLILTMYLVLSASASSGFFLLPGLHPTRLSVCNSKVLSPSPRTSRKLPNINDIFLGKWIQLCGTGHGASQSDTTYSNAILLVVQAQQWAEGRSL